LQKIHEYAPSILSGQGTKKDFYHSVPAAVKVLAHRYGTGRVRRDDDAIQQERRSSACPLLPFIVFISIMAKTAVYKTVK